MNPTQRLHEAVRASDLAGVRAAIAAGAEVNAKMDCALTRWNRGWPPVLAPLYMWSETGRQGDSIEIARVLLEAGADVRATSHDGFDAATVASLTGSVEALRLVLAAGADANATGNLFGPPISTALASRDLSLLRTLLDAGADPAARIPVWGTPLNYATETGNLVAVELLLERAGSATVNTVVDCEGPPLASAVSANHVEVARRLLAAGADPNQEGPWIDTPIKIAVECAGHEMVRLLLDAGADPSVRGWCNKTALDAAVKRDDPDAPEIIRLLTEAIRTRGVVNEGQGE